LREAVEVLKRRVARGNVGDETLRTWLQPWLNCETSIDSVASATLLWDEESWSVLSPCGAEITAPWAVTLMLLHLPALRAFWKTSMRASRLRRLQKVLPKAWPLDPASVPAGAVIAGLGITSWAQLPQKMAQGMSFRTMNFSNEVIELSADRSQQFDQLMNRVTTEPWVLAENTKARVDQQTLTAAWTRNEAGRVILVD
jgi:hypothetical protein